LTIWAAISWYSAGPIITLKGWLTSSDYVGIIVNQIVSWNDAIFFRWQVAHTYSRIVHSWFEEHVDALHHLPWPAQSPDLYLRTTVVSFRGYGEKQIPSSLISPATRRCSPWRVVQYSVRDYSELLYIWVYSKEDANCITCKWWPSSILIKKCVSFTTVSIILSILCAQKWDSQRTKMLRKPTKCTVFSHKHYIKTLKINSHTYFDPYRIIGRDRNMLFFKF